MTQQECKTLLTDTGCDLLMSMKDMCFTDGVEDNHKTILENLVCIAVWKTMIYYNIDMQQTFQGRYTVMMVWDHVEYFRFFQICNLNR